jgi:hypothetical protein
MIFIPAVVVGASLLGGALVVFVRQRRRRMGNKKVRVSVQLDVHDYNMLRVWADKNDQTLSDYVRKVLVASVPQQEKKRMNGDGKKSVVDAAFEEAEKQDGAAGVHQGVFPVPPTRKPQKGVVTEAERTHPLQRVLKTGSTPLPVVPPGPHPCAHLMHQMVPENMKGQCQGTCNQSSQRGRICYWPPTSARNCPVFESKVPAQRGL